MTRRSRYRFPIGHIFAAAQIVRGGGEVDLEPDFRKLAAKAERAGLKAVICSAENMGAPWAASHVAVAQKYFDCQVIAYLRRQDDWMLSSWAQWQFKRGESLEAISAASQAVSVTASTAIRLKATSQPLVPSVCMCARSRARTWWAVTWWPTSGTRRVLMAAGLKSPNPEMCLSVQSLPTRSRKVPICSITHTTMRSRAILTSSTNTGVGSRSRDYPLRSAVISWRISGRRMTGLKIPYLPGTTSAHGGLCRKRKMRRRWRQSARVTCQACKVGGTGEFEYGRAAQHQAGRGPDQGIARSGLKNWRRVGRSRGLMVL